MVYIVYTYYMYLVYIVYTAYCVYAIYIPYIIHIIYTCPPCATHFYFLCFFFPLYMLCPPHTAHTAVRKMASRAATSFVYAAAGQVDTKKKDIKKKCSWMYSSSRYVSSYYYNRPACFVCAAARGI